MQSRRPSGRGKDSDVIEKPMPDPTHPLIDYTAAVNTLMIDDMRTLRRHHPSLAGDFDELDQATLGYWRRLETEVEALKRDMDDLREKLTNLLKGPQ